MARRLSENELWMLSFYRTSEIGGALFFGRLAASMRPGPIQRDMTKHFADESRHAWEWTDCIARLGAEPLKLARTYQDEYFDTAGMPANLMEVLALTQVFEMRVLGHYMAHRRLPGVPETVAETLSRIVEDEKWHIAWVGQALKDMEPDYGRDSIVAARRRYLRADKEIYRRLTEEHAERLVAFRDRALDTTPEDQP
jgi:hypothetical protein